MPDTSGCCVCSALFRRISLRGAMAPEWYPWSISQGPGKVAKCPSWSPGAPSRRHTRAACYLRPGPARPWYELDKSRLCRGPVVTPARRWSKEIEVERFTLRLALLNEPLPSLTDSDKARVTTRDHPVGNVVVEGRWIGLRETL